MQEPPSETPGSPLHPAPNEEIDPLSLPTTQLENNDIDLNPELYSDNDNVNLGNSNSNNKDNINNDNNGATAYYTEPNLTSNNINGNNSNIANYEEYGKNNSKGLLQQLNLRSAALETENLKQSFESPEHQNTVLPLQTKLIHQITEPFQQIYLQFKNNFDSSPQAHPITSAQESRFINIIDEQLLQIQRKFVKQQSDTKITYSCSNLIMDLDGVLDTLWLLIQLKQRLFGQQDYYIKILGDLEDYINHYRRIFDEIWIDSNVQGKFLDLEIKKVGAFFKFLQKLDLQLSLLIDGYYLHSGKVQTVNLDADTQQQKQSIGQDLQRFSSTGLTRLLLIISRTRLAIIEKIDAVRVKVLQQEIRDLLELEVSRIFEGVLERS